MTGPRKRLRADPSNLGRVGAAVAVLVTVLAVLAAIGSPRSAAQGTDTTTTAPGDGPLTLVEQTSWVAPEGIFELGLALDDPPPGAQLIVEVYPAVITRTGFGRSIAGEGLGSPLRPGLPVVPVDALATDAAGARRASFLVSATDTPPFGIRLSAAGVYPVRVAVADGAGNEIDSFVTHLVRLPEAGPGLSLAFSLVAPLQAPPAFQPDEQVQIEPEALDRLTTTIEALARRPGVPLAVWPTPETVDALAATGSAETDAALSALTRALTGRQTIANTFVGLDLGTWASAALTDLDTDLELTQQLVSGPEALAATTGARPDGRTWVVTPSTNGDALTRLREAGVRQLVVPEGMLDPAPGTESGSFLSTFDVLDTDGEPIRAVQSDALLSERLIATPDPVLNAHVLLADLALLYFERPSIERGAVLAIPAEFPVPEPTWNALLDGLADEVGPSARRVVTPMVLDELFRVVEPADGEGSDPLVRSFSGGPTVSLDGFAERATSTRERIESYASMVGPTSERPEQLERQVLTAGAAGTSDERRSAFLAGVDADIAAQLDALVIPEGQQITLTDRTSRIPLTFENPLPVAVDVKVILASDKLDFPNGSEQIVTLPPATTTRIEVEVETRASGAFPLDLAVRSPDDGLTVGTARLTVRSTAISGIGLVLSALAGVFLLVWWARHFHKVRRSRRLVSTDHPTMRQAPGQQGDDTATTPTGPDGASATLPPTAAERATNEGNHVRSPHRH